MIVFGREIQDFSHARTKEFLLTDRGNYCSQSLAGNTRKYHGLLVHQGRLLFSTCDEYLNGERISVASYKGMRQDEGLRHLYGFSLHPPQFFYMVGDTILRKSIEFDGCVHVRYSAWGEGELKIVPLVTDRGIHAVEGKLNTAGNPNQSAVEMEHLNLVGRGCSFTSKPDWYRNIWYEEDSARGYSCQEDLYTPGYFTAKGRNWTITIHGNPPGLLPSPSAPHRVPGNPLSCLYHAAEDFLVGDTLVAGYHWFTEPWGRDTFVSLPGLLLYRGKFREAESVFRYFARRMRRGVIPNRIPDSYHSSDATLWFVWALDQYRREGGRADFLQEMQPCIEEILANYGEGGVATLEGDLIQVAPQSTWMDTVYTPREGKPVEVNALWIHTLIYASASGMDTPFRPEAVRRTFARFWNDQKGYFNDCLDPMDSTLRPNQIVALSLGFADSNQEQQVIEMVRKHLLTPYGLRTLAPYEPGYIGHYSGDSSYHNGSAWPWLLGPYIEALLRAGDDPERLRLLFQPLFVHLHDAGLGTVSEYFDGDAPHTPQGCIAQAWSVAELLRAYSLIERAMHSIEAKPKGMSLTKDLFEE